MVSNKACECFNKRTDGETMDKSYFRQTHFVGDGQKVKDKERLIRSGSEKKGTEVGRCL